MKPGLKLLKIGGAIVDDEIALSSVLHLFSKIEGAKVLVHGGGRLATDLAGRLQIKQTLIEGRRVTDAETLKIAVMVYAGLINKSIVAKLQAEGVSTIGICGADQDLIRSEKRAAEPRDYGWVGDVKSVRSEVLLKWLQAGVAPVIAPITHDGKGQLLNTNADTIAQEVAKALATDFEVSLIYSFEKAGVLLRVEDESSLIPEITFDQFRRLKQEEKIFAGMIPKLENAFRAMESGVKEVILGRAEALPELLCGKTGTKLIHGKNKY